MAFTGVTPVNSIKVSNMQSNDCIKEATRPKARIEPTLPKKSRVVWHILWKDFSESYCVILICQLK